MKPKLADTTFGYLANCPSIDNIQPCLPPSGGQIKPEIPAQAARNTSSSPGLGERCLLPGFSLWAAETQASPFPSGCTEAPLSSTVTLFCSQLFLIYIILQICFIAQAQPTGTQTPERTTSSQGKMKFLKLTSSPPATCLHTEQQDAKPNEKV